MEGIINIEKTKEDIERCMKIVAEFIDEPLSNELMIVLTKEVMDTSLSIGGDFADDNIRNIAKQYKDTNGFERFKKVHRGIV